ncbi:VOC family protein [Sphingomonas adhaesiva]|uniref:VOC family protein n=1 Tax=Sphingomonas adhaesiva TaxID=28212 RepID=UPI002FFC26B8
MSVTPAIIPVLRYADAPAAIAFLCTAFGFERHAVYPDPADANRIAHAELRRAGQMVILSTAMATPFAEAAGMRTAEEIGGITQAIYVVVDEVDRHAAVAQAAGARIFLPPQDQSHGGRSYSVFDSERNAWTFGSYDPLA